MKAMRIDAEGFWYRDAAEAIPFEPRDAATLAARAEIRRALQEMVAQSGELLHGIFEGGAGWRIDLDNALLYNIGGRVGAAARYGVLLERRRRTDGQAGFRYRFRVTGGSRLTESFAGQPVVELEDVPLPGPPRQWWEIWSAVRTSPKVRILSQAPRGEVALRLGVGAPQFAGVVNPEFVKTLIDGTFTALHAHGDRVSAVKVGRRLASRVDLEAAEIVELLVSEERSALGRCRHLIGLRGQGVQCHPEDIRLAALLIEIDRSAAAWTLSGRISTA